MRKPFNLPQYSAAIYIYQSISGYYIKTDETRSNALQTRFPDDLRPEPPRCSQIKGNAERLLVSRERSKTGSYKFISGLQTTEFRNWYVGNDYEMKNGKKITSIILFRFSDDYSRMIMYYFAGYDKSKKSLRLKFSRLAIPALLNTKGRPEPPFNAFNLAIQTGQPVCNTDNKNMVLE